MKQLPLEPPLPSEASYSSSRQTPSSMIEPPILNPATFAAGRLDSATLDSGTLDTAEPDSEVQEPFLDKEAPPIGLAVVVESQLEVPRPKRWWLSIRWWGKLPFRIAYRVFQFASLVLLLAIASSIPILQLAALGYLLEVGRRISLRQAGTSLLPGLNQATRIGVIAAGTGLCWLPVWLVSDYAYSAELIESGGRLAQRWHITAWIFSIAWVTHVTWAAMRGGKWYHFVWPAPIRFFKEIWRPSTWGKAEDGLWQYTIGLQLPKLAWLGLRAALVGIIWLAVPATMMIIGVQANNQPIRVLIGIIGGLSMMLVIMYLPFLQLQMARENRFRSGFDIRTLRADFKKAPWAFFASFFVTLAMSLPLFLFRIESLPKELLWLPCLFFILLTLPARALTGWALYRGHREIPKRLWLSRWTAWSLQLVAVPIYLLFLYLSSIASWDGRLIFFIQHAFLVPVPFSGN